MPLPRLQRICLPAPLLVGSTAAEHSPMGLLGVKGQGRETGRLQPQGASAKEADPACCTAPWSVFTGEIRSHPRVRFQPHFSLQAALASQCHLSRELELEKNFHCVRARAFSGGRESSFWTGSRLLIGGLSRRASACLVKNRQRLEQGGPGKSSA